MGPRDVIRDTMMMSQQIIDAYLSDLSDSDLLMVPVAGMNPIAWQVGHLIASEYRFIDMIQAGVSPALPAGFEEAHNKTAAESGSTSGYLTLQEYRSLWKAQREATLGLLDRMSDADLDRGDPEVYPAYAPTVGAILNMTGLHPLMHAGQFVAVRRALGKPITI